MKKCTEWPDIYNHAAKILAGTCNTTSSWTKGQRGRSMNGYLSSFLLGPLVFTSRVRRSYSFSFVTGEM
jgi:hypothetical protein